MIPDLDYRSKTKTHDAQRKAVALYDATWSYSDVTCACSISL